ncbi:MFS transporter [Micrococcoides hystricis]|uniref:MFS transporter n=1 Tax=Micrococcoides hystricis TaxID=1572761 RepID=A0ABV6PAT8_9MICC
MVSANKTPSGRLWTGNFVLAIGANFFISMVFYLLMTTMAQYAVEQFSASDAAGGFASSAFILGALIARVIVGKYLDFIGRRRLLLFALTGYVLVGLAYFVTTSVEWLWVVRFFHGAGFGAANTSLGASVMMLLPPLRRGEGTGYFGISTTLAAAVGPGLAVTLIGGPGFDAVFVLAVASCFFALLAAFFLRLPERTVTDQERLDKHRWKLSDVLDPHALPISVIIGLAGTAYATVLAFVNSFAQAEDFSMAGLFFLVYAVSMLLARLVLGRVQDYYGDNVVSYPTMVSFVLALVLLSFTQTDWQLLLAGILAGWGFGAMMPIFQTVAVTQAPDHRVAITTSTFYIMLDIGTVAGPLLGGLLVTAWGYRGMYLAMAALMAVTVVVYHFVHGHKRYVRRLHYQADPQP